MKSSSRLLKSIHTMPAAAFTAIAPELMIKFGKNPVVSFFIIMQSLDKHFLLGGKPVLTGMMQVFADLGKAIFTKTVKIAFGQ